MTSRGAPSRPEPESAGNTTVVITLSRGALPGLTSLLRGHGLRVRHAPLLKVKPPDSWASLDAALRDLDRYAAIALTSRWAARAIVARAATIRAASLPEFWVSGAAEELELRSLWRYARIRTCGGGSAPAEALAESLAASLVARGVRSPVLYPCSQSRRDAFPAGLRAAGLAVHEVDAYRRVFASPREARSACRGAHLVVVGSPSVAKLLRSTVSRRLALVALGPTTARAARELDWVPQAVSQAPTALETARAVESALGLL